MSFLFEPFWGIVDRSREGSEGKVIVRCLKDWRHGVSVTAERDIGRVLGRIVKGDVDARDKVVYVAGSSVAYGELAGMVQRVVGQGVVVERETWGVEGLREQARRDPGDGVKAYRVAFAGEGVAWDKKETVNEELGMEMLGVEEYAKELFGKRVGGEEAV